MYEIWFFYSNTCEPCKQLKPKVEALASSLSVPLTFYDAIHSENEALVIEHRIRAVPTVLLRRDGKTLLTAVGFSYNEAEFRDAILDTED